jgi:membrane-bound lytic murein transglycosylase B
MLKTNRAGRQDERAFEMRRVVLPILVVAFIVATAATTPAATSTPAEWVQSFWPAARAAGVSRPVYDAALGNFEPDPDVIKRAVTQAEFNMPIWNYIDMMVSEERINGGKAALAKYGDTLAKIEERYGVDRYIVVAIWGMESLYGTALSNPKLVKNTIRSLATLAYSGGRLAKFARQQLVVALVIVQRGDVTVKGMIGSWAGAMGQTQFIPTTYIAFAVDFEGDGHRNIWTSAPDALASTANYLRKSGWRPDETWGYEVALPADFNLKKSGTHTLADWHKLGIDRVGGKAYPRPGDRASLFLPAGHEGPVFLILGNFQAIKHYNNANSYALAVGHLADRLRGGGPFLTAWPAHEPPLSQEERQKLQLLLTARGFYSGDVDGNIGSGSREAIKNYQLAIGVTPSGVESRGLLEMLETGR